MSRVQRLLRKARRILQERITHPVRDRPAHPKYGKMTGNGTPEDPVAFQIWSIDRHSTAQAARLNISDKRTTRLRPEIATLAPHLTELNLRDLPLRDLGPVGTLDKLQSLTVLNCPIEDLSPLAALTDLQTLEIAGKTLENLHSLPDLPALTRLKIGHGAAGALGARMPLLTQLDAQFASKFETRVLEGMPLLERLSLSNIADLSALQNVPKLQELTLQTQATDLSPLATLGAVHTLKLTAPTAQDLAPLAAMTELRDVHLTVPHAVSFAPLAQMEHMHTLLALEHMQDNALDWVQGCTALSTLRLHLAADTDLSPLHALPHLEDLFLRLHGDVDLTPLAGLTQVKHLMLNTKDVTHPIADLCVPPNLTSLNLIGSAVTSLRGIERCQRMQTLSLQDTAIRTLDAIQDLPQLARISLTKSPVADLSPLRTLPAFTAPDAKAELYLRDTPALERYPSLAPLARSTWGREGDLAARDLARAAVAHVS